MTELLAKVSRHACERVMQIQRNGGMRAAILVAIVLAVILCLLNRLAGGYWLSLWGSVSTFLLLLGAAEALLHARDSGDRASSMCVLAIGGGCGMILGAGYGFAAAAILKSAFFGACVGVSVCSMLERTSHRYKPLTSTGIATSFVSTALVLVVLHALWIVRPSDSFSQASLIGLRRAPPKSVLSASELKAVASVNESELSGKGELASRPPSSNGEVVGSYEGDTPRPLTHAIAMLCESEPEPVDVCFCLRRGPNRVVYASWDGAGWTWMPAPSAPSSPSVTPSSATTNPTSSSAESSSAATKALSGWVDALNISSPVPVYGDDASLTEDVSPRSQIQATITELERKLTDDPDNAKIKSQIASLRSLLVPVTYDSRDPQAFQETDRVGRWLPSGKTKQETVAHWVSQFRADQELLPVEVQRVVVDGKACIVVFASDGQKLSTSRQAVSKDDMVVAGEALGRESLDQAKARAAGFMDALYSQQREKWGNLTDADAITLAVRETRADRIAKREAAQQRDAKWAQERRRAKRSHDLLADVIRRKGFRLCKKFPEVEYSLGRARENEFCLHQCSLWHLEDGNTDRIVLVAAVEPVWEDDGWLSDEMEARCALFRLVTVLAGRVACGVPVRKLQLLERTGRPPIVKTLENGTTEFLALVACGGEHCDIEWEPSTRVFPSIDKEMTVIRTGNAILTADPFTDYGKAQTIVDAAIRRLVSGGRLRR